MNDPRTSGPANPVLLPEALSAGMLVGTGRFLLKKGLGQGGMGIVWLAHDLRLKEPVALKFLPSALAFNPVTLEDFRKETLRSRRLSHPNIVRIHDLCEPPGEAPFISMEYVDGSNLHYLRANRASSVLSWEFLVPILRQLCGALSYAHQERVLHRDLKPANLMLDSNQRLKLADFGLSCILPEGGVLREPANGTLAYMSPQQADGNQPEATDDIYSLGATFYELLTSKPPFYTGDLGYQIRNTRPAHIHERLADLELTNDVPSEAAALIMACLAKEPSERPQSARWILNWLDASESLVSEMEAESATTVITGVEPKTESGLDGASTPARGWYGRKPWVMAAASLICVLLAQFWLMRTINAKRIPPTESSNFVTEAATEEGFERLFNGKDLAGWSSEPGIWAVQDGVIRGHVSGTAKAEHHKWLTWRMGLFDDFELRAECRLLYGKAGIIYRGKEVSAGNLSGFEFAISTDATGEMLSISPSRTYTLVRPENYAASPVGWSAWVPVAIVAQGNHLIHQVGGAVVADVRDGASWSRPAPSLVGFSLVSGTEEATVEFRNVRIKRLKLVK